MIKKLTPFLKEYKIYTILTPITVIAEVLLEIFIPLLMSKIIDVGIPNKDINYVIKTGVLMMLMALFSLLFGVLSGKFAAIASMGFAKGLRKELFNKVQGFSFSNIDKFSTASLVTRLTTDVTNTQNAFMMIIRMMVRAPIMLISATIMAFSINKSLVVVFLVAIPILAIALVIIVSTAFPRFGIMLKKYDIMNSAVQENLVAMRVVKAFVRSKYEKEKFEDATDKLRYAQLRAEKVVIFNMPIMQFTMYGCMIAIVWFGGNMIIGGSMMTGELMSFISYVTQILMSLMMISMVFISTVLSKASVARIIEVMDEKVDILDSDLSAEIFVEDGSVIFENVSFSYSKNKKNLTISNINFKINSGETIGIIGGTGSSKSSLVQLIPRLYDVMDGKIIVGKHDVRDYKLETLRDCVAMVLQKNVLFSGTIKENLKWGNLNASEKQIVEACKSAQAHDFIMSLPDGYETELGQGGVNVSGGQKQRICIARALLKNPKIIILDDSTSAVDTSTDAKIRQSFIEKLSDTTTIIIAQRISSVCDADKIIVLNDGKIDDIGSHEQLLSRNQIYIEVYNSQMRGDIEYAR
ncbi:ABC transporter ATP-binding protein [Clostridium lacusfryxellense]|uniref:ABC transporter ATP-binding protein n=1 Tax=Clostridium lacusfryxellense TaxID=205328 RepID=UPI001C0D8EBE|nr:ABC transporter ATP-binding protein [Clostridium lacusfryxellense]MBU3113033.1 ABC transporter ATP-binding protein/permease [Clostridium lacusfryxellense]